MAGELWRATAQVGLESTYGTSVPATRIVYLRDDLNLDPNLEARRHRFMTGSRDNVRAQTMGPKRPAGRMSMSMSYDEIIEALLITIAAGVTPSGGIWTFAPGASAPASMTMEWNNGAEVYEGSGLYGNVLTITGSAGGANEVNVDLVGKNLVLDSLTGSLAQRVPTFLEGWQSRIYLENFLGTPKTTIKAGWLTNWTLTFNNNIGEKFFADNLNAIGARPMGMLDVSAELTFEASVAQSATEYTAAVAGTGRVVTLVFGDDTNYVQIALPGAWETFALNETDGGTRVYRARLSYLYDPTNAFGVQFKVKNSRATAW